MGAREFPGSGVTHPVVLAAIVLLALNDHLLKRAYPGVVTGKLSDAAGLCFFPVFLEALFELVASRWRPPFEPRWTHAVGSVLLTLIGFALAKSTELGADAYRVALGVLQWPFGALRAVLAGREVPGLWRVAFTRDPSDLWVLPCVLVPLWLAKRRVERARAQPL